MSVIHLPERHMFYLSGFAGRTPENSPHVVYDVVGPKAWNFSHTETPPDLQGQGLARKVVEGAFSHCKENNIDYSSSTCWYVVKLMKDSKM